MVTMKSFFINVLPNSSSSSTYDGICDVVEVRLLVTRREEEVV